MTHLMPLKLRIALMSSGKDMGSGHIKLSVTGTMFFLPARAVTISCKVNDHFSEYMCMYTNVMSRHVKARMTARKKVNNKKNIDATGLTAQACNSHAFCKS